MRRIVGALVGVVACVVGCTDSVELGPLFQQNADVGPVGREGSVSFDAGRDTYTVSGSGANIWGTEDAFHFVWTPVAGDLRMTARVSFTEEEGDPHRKAGWMVRESGDADAAYVDVAVHADGLIALQFRRVTGGPTEEVRAITTGAAQAVLERTADVFSLSVMDSRGEVEPVGAVRVALPATALAGLFVSSHQDGRLATAEFSGVSLDAVPAGPDQERVTESTLETIDIETGRRAVVYRAVAHFEAPNWSRDGGHFLFNQSGRIFRLPVEGGDPIMIDTGDADRCNNDHGLSPDGSLLAISHSPAGRSLIYVLPAEGGTPRLVTEQGPSYWHGWSPDGKTLAYCAERNGEYDIYTIPVSGGRETRLTDAPGLDDGPDYSPDGRYIYFNSVRTGLMKIWRMTPEGKDQEQVTTDSDWADWFPHPSPDGRYLVFLSYDKSVEGHPPNREVVLRLMDLEEGGEPRIIARLFGGQGTLNVPSWSPDSRQFSFVSYRQVPK